MSTHHRELPRSVERYLATKVADRAALVDSVFAAHATVHDEGRTYVGTDAIRQWATDLAQQFTITSTLDQLVQDGDQVIAHFTYTGDFPGSPAQRSSHFTVERVERGEQGEQRLITTLDIRE
ncbi:nuclear transport factor 2 family protein [Peterkaempfera bronchialis]|uniref:Nuclear transport factor 2 family protein n=1 Tax=Peterkaempfera bronchialis TaxID=2126346 RepID=A0A345T1B5_9ACTN|nr:nuclear transport factor 2 family protein [Peterkaempfera bronchialis]AXI79770.1 nuclear transport factor 2 family protein [Peterkaempfera bronchialis]